MLDGLLLVNKPSGPTSYDVIRVAKRCVRGVKIGHCGTLDPIASGLLILLFGKATKKQSTYMGQDKVYRSEVKLGLKTDSGDVTGKTIEEKPVPPLNLQMVKDALNGLMGERDQMPPMYSALKVGGTPLYKMARKGLTVERKPRRIRISTIELIGMPASDVLDIRVHCSTGTYIRTLAEEIGEQLGSVATMKSLVRESIGTFHINDAVSGDELFRWTEANLRDRVQVLS